MGTASSLGSHLLGLLLLAATSTAIGAQVQAARCAAADTACIAEGRRAAWARTDSAAAHVDTLVVEFEAVKLSLGDSLQIASALQTRPLDRAGKVVKYAAPLYFATPASVARVRRGYLIGVGAGKAVLHIGVSRSNSSATAIDERPVTRVQVIVAP